jgi:hypothetical protein
MNQTALISLQFSINFKEREDKKSSQRQNFLAQPNASSPVTASLHDPAARPVHLRASLPVW